MKIVLMVCLPYLVLSFFSVEAGDLELKIDANKTNYLLAEPVVLYVSLQNAGNEVVELPLLLDPVSNFVHYRLKVPEEESESTFFPWAIASYAAPATEFAPGEVVREEVKFFFGAGGWLFREPGTYQITASMDDFSLSSNTLTITVLAPTDEQTTAAAELFLESNEVGYFLLFEGGDHLTKGIQRLEQVAAQYPNTPHATYANQALGTRLVTDFANLGEGNRRLEDPEGAIPFLELAKQNPVGVYDILHTQVSLYEAHTKLNNTVEAESALQELVQLAATQFEEFLPFVETFLENKGIPMPDTTTPPGCLLYAVHNQSQQESQLFTVNLAAENLEIKPVNLKLSGHDIAVVAADFDGDGEDEIAMAAKEGGHTVTLSELDGTIIRAFPVSARGISVAAGDLNGNGTAEIIVASRAANHDSLQVYAADGTLLGPIVMFDKNTRMSPAVGDIDGDNIVDIIAGRMLKKDKVAVYNSASQALSHLSVFQSVSRSRKTTGVNVASDDFNSDGKAEIVAVMASKGSQVEIYTSEGTLLNAWTAFDNSDGAVVTVGNVVDDSQPEIIVGEAKGTRIGVFNRDGEKLVEFQAVAHGRVSSLSRFRCQEE